MQNRSLSILIKPARPDSALWVSRDSPTPPHHQQESREEGAQPSPDPPPPRSLLALCGLLAFALSSRFWGSKTNRGPGSQARFCWSPPHLEHGPSPKSPLWSESQARARNRPLDPPCPLCSGEDLKGWVRGREFISEQQMATSV